MDTLNFILVLLIICCGLAMVYILMFKKNKYFFRVRLMTGSKRLIIDTVAIEKKTEKGVKYLFVKKFKELVPMPPDDSIDLSIKGKKVVEAYRDERGNYAYVKDRGHVEFFEPIDTEMQVLFADQIQKANTRDAGWKQQIPLIIGLGFVVVMVLGGLLLVGEPLKALEQYTTGVGNNINKGLTTMDSILEKQIQLEKDLQIIKADLDTEAIENPPN